MSELLLKMAILALLTHGIRALARVTGARRGSLLLGLPSTTAIALISCVQEDGMSAAAEMAEASLFGLIAAVALSLTFARALVAGRRLAWSAAAAVAAYFAVAWSSVFVPEPGAVGRLLIAAAAVVTACRLVGRMPAVAGGPAAIRPSQARCLALRTFVPMTCLAVVTLLRESVGMEWAGLLSTFPGMTLTVLVVTYLESGPSEASSVARGLPLANLGMIAFVAAFRFGGPAVGPGWSTALGYLLSAATLLTVGGWAPPAVPRLRLHEARRAASARLRRVSVEPALRIVTERRRLHTPRRRTRPAPRRRRLSPLVEPAGL
jgi:hypothetical protein